jgi:PAS domain S-box-containing protein
MDPPPRPGLPPRTRLLLALAGAAAVVNIAVGLMPLPDRPALALQNGLHLAASLSAALACLFAAQRETGRKQLGWKLLGAGASAWAAGQVVWTWYEVVLGVAVPYPGIADVGYFAMYPPALAGLLLLSPLTTKGWSMRAGILLDAVLSTLAAVVLAWPLVLHHGVHDAPSLSAGYVTIAYAVADIVLLGLVGGILLRGLHAWRSSLGFAYAAFCLILFADLGFLAQVFRGGYVTGQLLDAGWIAGFLVLAAAATAPAPMAVDPSGQRYSRLVGHVLPLVAVLVGIVGFLVAQANEAHGPIWQLVLVMMFLAAVARQALATWEYAAAVHDREAAQADYRDLFTNMAEGFAHCRFVQDGPRLDIEYLHVNQNFEAHTGLKVAAGQRISRLIPGFEQANPAALAAYERVAKGGRAERFETEVKAIGRWLDITAYPAGPGEFVAVFEDITKRKRLELDLRERIKEITALSAVATAGAKAEDLQALLDQTVRSLEKAFLHDDAWVLARAGGLAATSEGPQPEGPELRAEFSSTSGDGAISVRYRTTHEPRDDGPFLAEERILVDSVAGLITTVLGRRSEAARVRFQAHLLENVSQAIAATDLEGRVSYWNPAAERLFGWLRGEAIGRPIVDLWGDVLVLSPQVEPDEPSPAGDYPMRRKDGSPVLVSLATSPLLGPAGALEGFIAIAQDATQARAQALALKRRERALTLISAVSEALIRATSERHLLQEICDIAVRTGGYRLAWVGLARDTSGHPVEAVAFAGHGAGYLKTVDVTWDNAPRGQVTGKCIREGRTVAMRDMAREPAFAPWREQALAHGYASSISLFLPLGEDRGALMMYSEQAAAFEPDEVNLLEQMAADLAFGVRMLRLRTKQATLTAMLDDAQELSRIGAWDYDAAARKVTWTREVYRIHEVPESFDPSEASRDMQFYTAEDQARLDAAFRAAIERGKPYDLELRLTTARGRRLHVRTVAVPEVREGKVVRVRGNLMDVTEQKEAADALRRSEARMREAQATAHLGSWELDIPTDRLTWSDEIFRIFEIDPARFPATYEAFLAAIHPEDRKFVDEAFRASLDKREPYVVAHRLLMPDGRVKHVLEQGRSDYGPDGQPLRSVGTVLDVTEATMLQQALRTSEDTNRRLVDESPLAIVRVSREGRFLAANPAAVKAYGVPDLPALLRRSVQDFYVRPEERETQLAEAESAQGQHGRVTEMHRPDGTRFWARSHSHAVRDPDGKVAYYEGIFEDITAQRLAEEARQELAHKEQEVKRLEELNRMRMDFLNTAAHDLKTPLTPLKLQMATLRAKGGLDPKQKASLDLMDRSVNRFQALIEDMLDAARLQAGRLKLKRSSVALAPLVQEAVASFEEATRQNAQQVDVRVDAALMVDADPNKLMQVLMNLVSNAVKYTANGGAIQVRGGADGDAAHLSVRDSGLGMDADQLSRLFQPFVRLHEGIAGTAKGTGLGLYISKGIVESHGGRLWAESEGPGHGSTFHLAWPLARTVQAQAGQAVGEPSASGTSRPQG